MKRAAFARGEQAEDEPSADRPEPHMPTLLPEISEAERSEAARRAAITAAVVHEAVREEGEHELRRNPAALAWSGLAAGLSMGFSLVTQGLLLAYLPNAGWRPLISSLGYTVGFVIVVLGRQQLFTENTLTGILPLLAHPNRDTIARLVRLWAIVLVTNIAGTIIIAAVLAHTAVFPPEVKRAFFTLGQDALRDDFGATLLRAVFAGWLIALMVWLLPAADATRLHVIILITYVVALGGFSHIVAGSVDVLYLVNAGGASWLAYLGQFFLPTLLGNALGGVALVAALNFAQVATE